MGGFKPTKDFGVASTLNLEKFFASLSPDERHGLLDTSFRQLAQDIGISVSELDAAMCEHLRQMGLWEDSDV